MEEQIERYNPILYNDPWDCERCTFHNEAGDVRCAMCDFSKYGNNDAHQSEAAALINAEEFKRIEDEMLEQMRGEWACKQCSYVNPDLEEPLVMCDKCGFPRPDDNQCEEDFQNVLSGATAGDK